MQRRLDKKLSQKAIFALKLTDPARQSEMFRAGRSAPGVGPGQTILAARGSRTFQPSGVL